MKLEPIYRPMAEDIGIAFTYMLLKERTPEQSISHKVMPSLEDHIKFVESNPYAEWYLILDERKLVGAIYLTRQREVGVAILKDERNKGYAEQAIKALMEKHPGRFLANINPKNEASIALFAKFGAKHIQNTYEF